MKDLKGYIKGQAIILENALPEGIEEGEIVDVVIISRLNKKHQFPTFKLGIKDNCLSREEISFISR